MFFVAFQYGILGQLWYLIVSITDLHLLFYFEIKLSNDLRSLQVVLRSFVSFWSLPFKINKSLVLQKIPNLV